MDWTMPANDQYYWKGAPRRYIGATPMHGSQTKDRSNCLAGVHWPNDYEYEALHAAVEIGKQKWSQKWCVEVKVRNSNHVARVTCDPDQFWSPLSPYHCQIVRRSNPDAAGCLNEKSWYGLPVWADQGVPRRPRHAYQDTGLFHGPGDCCDGCREQVNAHHRTVIHHHRHGARHLHHEAAPPSSALERLFAGFGLVRR